jgi:hypothetical protein
MDRVTAALENSCWVSRIIVRSLEGSLIHELP